ncbi:hypothetical protein [Agromyces bauzanensis]
MKRLVRGVVSQLTGPARWLGSWARRRPRLASVLATSVVLYVIGWISAPAANAAGGGEPTPDAPADHLFSTAGIRASHYSALFINRGDFFSGDKGIWAWFIDMAWGIHFWLVTTAIDTFTWLLQFKWVDVIAVPMEGLSTLISSIIDQFGVVPFALFLSGALVALLIVRGKFGKAIVELATVAVIFAALGGLLASPVQWITSPGGPLDTARDGGAQLSAAILRGDGDVQDVSSDENPVGETIIAPLVDLFLVLPAESISFGHIIDGDCGVTIDQAVKNLDPIKRDTNPVRDAVGTCDTDAKTYADNTGWFHLMSTIGVAAGSWWLMFFAWAVAVLLMVSVAGTLWMGFTASWRVVLALFPWSNRGKLFFSVAGMFAGAFFIITMQVILAGFLWLLTSAMPLLADLGMPIGYQLNLISWLGFAAIIVLAVILANHHKVAKRLAEKANQALENAGTKRDMMPVTGLPQGLKNIAQHRIANHELRKRASQPAGYTDARQITFVNPAGGAGAPGFAGAPINDGEYIATAGARPGSRPGGPGTGGGALAIGALTQAAAQSGNAAAGAAAKGASAIGTATRYALALKGGVAGVALEAAKDVAGVVVQRRIAVDRNGVGKVDKGNNGAASVNSSGARAGIGRVVQHNGSRVVSPAAGPERPTGRRISIGNDGVGTVVHDTTSAQRPAAPISTTSAIERVSPRALRS